MKKYIAEILFFITIFTANILVCLFAHFGICSVDFGIILEAIEMLIAFILNGIWIIGFLKQSDHASFFETRIPHKTGKSKRLDRLSTFANMSTILMLLNFALLWFL